jgi:rhamnosyl/mannosyltransferase
MRVLHAYKIYRPDVEGGVPEIMGLLTSRRAAGDEADILVARRRGLGRSLAWNGVPVRAVTSLGNLFSMPVAPTFPLALWRHARRVDVVALHAPFPLNDVGLLPGIHERVGLVVHWHSDIIGRKALLPLVAPFIRRTLSRADRIIVSSSSIVALSPFLQSCAEKCTVIPIGVDPDYWGRLDAEERSQVEELRGAHRRMVVASGRLVPYKGFDVLIRALPHIDAEAIVVGEGPQMQGLRRLARQLAVADRVHFAGNVSRSRLKTLLHAAQLFCFPSVTSAETFGIAQLEAMAAGKPIVNTALPTGVPLVARHGHEAITVAPGDACALAAGISRLLDDPALAERLGRAGRQRVETQLHQDVFIRKVRAVYAEVHAMRAGRIGAMHARQVVPGQSGG